MLTFVHARRATVASTPGQTTPAGRHDHRSSDVGYLPSIVPTTYPSVPRKPRTLPTWGLSGVPIAAGPAGRRGESRGILRTPVFKVLTSDRGGT